MSPLAIRAAFLPSLVHASFMAAPKAYNSSKGSMLIEIDTTGSLIPALSRKYIGTNTPWSSLVVIPYSPAKESSMPSAAIPLFPACWIISFTTTKSLLYAKVRSALNCFKSPDRVTFPFIATPSLKTAP